MSKKAKGQQLAMFNNGEELPLFTGSAYGSTPAPFVQVEIVKQSSLFPATFDELAKAEQAKKRQKAFMLVNGFTQAQMDAQRNKAEVISNNDMEYKRVLDDAIANTALYKGLAVVYRIGDSMYGWAYTAGPLGGTVLNVIVDGVEVDFVSRGGGCVTVVQG